LEETASCTRQWEQLEQPYYPAFVCSQEGDGGEKEKKKDETKQEETT
jgi:hypothetical protein